MPPLPMLYTLVSLSFLFPLVFSTGHAQPPTSQARPQNIRNLITLLGGVDGLKRRMQDEITTLREKYPNLKKEYWESLKQNIDEKELPTLIDRLVTTYDNLLTDEEVAEMLRFYESPTGKKVASALPQISTESSNLFLQWRQGLVKKVADMQGGLIRAASGGDMNKVKELLATGADVNARSNKGSTPLMASVESGNKTLVELLLSKGADPNLRDVRRLNAYQIALLRGQHDLMLLLKDKTKDTQPVEVRAVVAYLDRRQECLPVSKAASDTSRQVACLKTGDKVELSGLPTDNGWAMIRKPAEGWVRTSALKQTLVFGTHQRQKTPTRASRSTPSEYVADAPASPEASDEETTTSTETSEKPRIWWRR